MRALWLCLLTASPPNGAHHGLDPQAQPFLTPPVIHLLQAQPLIQP